VSRRQRLDDRFRASLAPTVLELFDESHMHAVPPGAESHFRVVVVSDTFTGLSRVARHRRMNALAADELASGLHALSLQAFTHEEWAAQAPVHASPPCLGGGKQEAATSARRSDD
jgi:BolA family transcriptional regulator, general stress-responsive regulator